jgi:hypothetical protein
MERLLCIILSLKRFKNVLCIFFLKRRKPVQYSQADVQYRNVGTVLKRVGPRIYMILENRLESNWQFMSNMAVCGLGDILRLPCLESNMAVCGIGDILRLFREQHDRLCSKMFASNFI